MKLPVDRHYTRSHMWVRREPDGSLSVGLTAPALEPLGELACVELPAIGRRVAAGEEVALIESAKAATGVDAPLAGEIIAANPVAMIPGRLNADPDGVWLFRLRPTQADDFDGLLDAEAYAAILACAP